MGQVTWHKIDFTTSEDEWREFRYRGVGASNVPAILGFDEYKCNLELFYEKIGGPVDDFESLPAIIGIDTESIIAKYWTYWDGNPANLAHNIKTNKVIRECEDIKSYCINSDMPFLFASMDRRICQYHPFNTPGALECKNTQRSIVERYENKVVPAHLIQNLVQVFTPLYEFGEIAYFMDNKKFDVVKLHDITPYGGLIEQIKNEIKIFWDCVIKGRKLYTERTDAKMRMLNRRVAEIDNEISLIEPPSQNTDVYLSYLTEKFKNRKAGINIIQGGPDLYKSAKTHKEIKMQIEDLNKKLIIEEVTLKNAMQSNEKMEFGKGMGFVSWSKSANNTRPFLNKVI